MNLCNGCRNAGSIISLEAALKDSERHIKQLVEQDSDRRQEITNQAQEIGRLGLELRDANRMIARLQVELDTAKEDNQ